MLHCAFERAVKERLISRNPTDDCIAPKVQKFERRRRDRTRYGARWLRCTPLRGLRRGLLFPPRLWPASVKERLISRNPTDDCIAPKVQKFERKTLRPEDMKAYLDAANTRGLLPIRGMCSRLASLRIFSWSFATESGWYISPVVGDGNMYHKPAKTKGEVPIRTSPLRRGSSYSGSACGSNKICKNHPAKKVLNIKQNPPKSQDFRGFLELLTRFELVTSSLPKAQNKYFHPKKEKIKNYGVQSNFAGSKKSFVLKMHFQNISLQFMLKSPCNLPDNDIQ